MVLSPGVMDVDVEADEAVAVLVADAGVDQLTASALALFFAAGF